MRSMLFNYFLPLVAQFVLRRGRRDDSHLNAVVQAQHTMRERRISDFTAIVKCPFVKCFSLTKRIVCNIFGLVARFESESIFKSISVVCNATVQRRTRYAYFFSPLLKSLFAPKRFIQSRVYRFGFIRICRSTYRDLMGHSILHTHAQCMIADCAPAIKRPRRTRFCFTERGQHQSSACVIGLLFLRCPFAVLGRVALVIVDALNRQVTRVPMSVGPALEGSVRVPRLAYAYASTAVAMVMRIRLVVTTLKHLAPHGIKMNVSGAALHLSSLAFGSNLQEAY